MDTQTTNFKYCLDDQFQLLKKSLQANYQNKCSYISPLPWRKGLTLSLDETFIERQGHLMIKEKSCWKLHDQWIDVDAVTLMALAFHYCQHSTQSIIAVEGKMGSGKTTLCKRILKDWAGESFDIMEGVCLLYMNVNEGKETTCVNEQNVCKLFDLPTNMDNSLVWKIFQEKQEEILVFIDINKTQTSLDWLRTICCKLMPRAKYIIFCRPDMLYKILDMSNVKILLQDFDHEKINKMLENLSIDYYIQDDILDVMNEDESITRLCMNPFLCTAFMVTCKEQFGVRFTDNSVKLIRTFIGFIWKRFVCESRVTLEDLDILMTSLSGVFIDIFENGGYLCESDVHNLEHGRLLLESGLLYQETYNPDLTTNILCYSFFDIIINEYACALHFSQTLLRRPEERGFIGAILRNPKWHTICRLTASILKEKAYLLIDELISDRLEVDQLKLLCDCVHECGSFNIPNDQLKEKRKLFEESLDFGNAEVTSSTLKGLKTILMQLHNLKDSSYPLRNRHRTTHINRLYKSCNDIFNEMDDDNIRCEMCIRYESSFICKRCQLANLQKKRKHTERNLMMSDIEEKLRRNNSTKFGSVKNNLNKYSRSLLDLSLSSCTITRETSMLSLEDINTVNGRKRDTATLKELSLKGSSVTSKNMVELISLVNSCHMERLYLMGDAENPGQPISNKLVDSFVMCICANLTHISLNDYHLGEYWMKRLCKIIKEKSMLLSIRISVSCIHELSVESAISLVKAVKTNLLVENVELYCGVQPMVIMTLFNFYEELLAKDERLHLVFL